jgi:hypothetical protein
MKTPEFFEMMDGYAVFRPVGEVTQEQAGRLIASAITFARERHIRRLMVSITGLTGFDPPSLAARYFYIREWARIAQGEVCVAMVTSAEVSNQEEIEGVIAENAGFRGKGFLSEAEALAWLRRVECVPEDDRFKFDREI